MISSLNSVEILHALARRKRLFAGIFLATNLAAATYLLVAPEIYKSSAILLVKFGNSSPEATVAARSRPSEISTNDRQEILASHVRILESRAVTKAALDVIGIENLYPDAKESAFPEETALKKLTKDLQVRVHDGTNTIDLSMRGENAATTQKFLQSLIDIYETRQAELYTTPFTGFLVQQVEQARIDLANAQATRDAFTVNNPGVSAAEAELGMLVGRRSELQARLRESVAKAQEQFARRQSLGGALNGMPAEVNTTDSERYRAVDDARNRLSELEAREAHMLSTYRPDSAAMVTLNSEIKQARTELEKREAEMNARTKTQPNSAYYDIVGAKLRAQAEEQAAIAPISLLQADLIELDKRISQMEENKSRYAELQRQVELSEENYKELTRKLDEARVAGNMNSENISRVAIVESASKPVRPDSPKALLTMLLAVMGGLLAAAATCLVRDLTNDTVSDAEQVERNVGLPVVAVFGSRGLDS